MQPLAARRTLHLISALALVLLATGCVPNVSWLPDSSGFVYTTAKGTLVRYDVTKGTRRVLVADTGTNTIWPTVSPDGKRIAVARLNLDKDQPHTLQVILYDLEGIKVQRSQRLDWKGLDLDKDSPRLGTQTHLYWAPQGDRLLVYGNGTTAVYAPGTDRVVKQWRGTQPLACGNTPIRPDGKGFLLGKHGDRFRKAAEPKVGEIVFVDWDGREGQIKPKDDRTTELLKSGDSPVKELVTWPVLFWSAWEGDVALVSWSEFRIRIDTDKRVVTVHALAEKEIPADQKDLHQQYTFPDGATRITVRSLEQKDAGLPHFRVELSGPRANKPRALVEVTAVAVLQPAPNKQWVAVRCGGTPETPKNKGQDLILVVSHKGEVAATIDVNE
jgi:hypothetical protein